MKSLILITTLLLTSPLLAQHSYFRIQTGYALPFASQAIGYESNTITTYTEQSYSGSRTSKVNYGTYGSGLNLGFAFGTHLGNKSVLDFELVHLSGNKNKTTDTDRDTYFGESYTYSTTQVSYAKGWVFSPSFIYTFSSSKISPYSKIGFTIAKTKIYNEEESNYSGQWGSNKNSEKFELSGGTGFGLKAGLGLNIEIKNNIMFFTELVLNSMNYSPGKGEVTESKSNGQNMLPQMPVAYKKYEFKKEISEKWSSNSGYNENKPSQQLKLSMPMSSLSFNVGFIFALKRKSIETTASE